METRTAVSPTSPRLLEQVRQRMRYLHYSLRTEKAYLYWIRMYVRWSGMRHPRELGEREVTAFLTMLASVRRVSASTHNQALSAILFLYKEVLGIDLPWLAEVRRPTSVRRIPSVLTQAEVRALPGATSESVSLVARLLYGTGMRLMEAMRLRVKDVDFTRNVIIVREAKGNKDRVVMLPQSLSHSLRQQVVAARAVWEQDRAQGHAGVDVPHALEFKYPKVGQTWGWF